jgi:hypothetical protein
VQRTDRLAPRVATAVAPRGAAAIFVSAALTTNVIAMPDDDTVHERRGQTPYAIEPETYSSEGAHTALVRSHGGHTRLDAAELYHEVHVVASVVRRRARGQQRNEVDGSRAVALRSHTTDTHSSVNDRHKRRRAHGQHDAGPSGACVHERSPRTCSPGTALMLFVTNFTISFENSCGAT